MGRFTIQVEAYATIILRTTDIVLLKLALEITFPQQNIMLHVERFLGVSERFRVSKIKELLNILTVEDVHEYVLPSICKRVSLYDVILTQTSSSVSGNQNDNLLKKTLLSFLEEVNKTDEKELEYVLNCLGYCKTSEKFTAIYCKSV